MSMMPKSKAAEDTSRNEEEAVCMCVVGTARHNLDMCHISNQFTCARLPSVSKSLLLLVPEKTEGFPDEADGERALQSTVSDIR